METPRIDALTPQQRACLRLVPVLFTDKAIAQRLGISPKTVSHHLAAARATLGVTDRYSAARALADRLSAGEEFPSPFLPIGDPRPDIATLAPDASPVTRLRDVATERTFAFDPALFQDPGFRDFGASRHEKAQRDALSPLQTITLICVIAMACMAIVISALPAAQTWSAIANRIDPHHK